MPNHDIIFYDGHCGLCHWSVKFAARHDSGGERFRYAPLQSEVYCQMIDVDQRAKLPDSVVVRTAGGKVLGSSDAVAYILQRIGGSWGWVGNMLARVPRALREAAYDFVAYARRYFSPGREDTCPLLPEPMRDRFLGCDTDESQP